MSKRKHRCLSRVGRKKIQVDFGDWAVVTAFCQAWNGSKPLTQQEVEALLRSIEIDECDEERRIVSFSTPCFLYSKTNEDIVPHPSCIDFTETTAVEPVLPSLSGLGALTKLTLKGNITILPSMMEDLKALKELTIALSNLDLAKTPLNSLFATFSFSKLQKLDLSGCISLRAIPNTIGNLGGSVQQLSLHVWFDHFVAMQANALETEHKRSFFLPPSMGGLTNLTALRLESDLNAYHKHPVLPSFHLIDPSLCFKWTKLQSIRTNLYLLTGLVPDPMQTPWPNLKEATILLPQIWNNSKLQQMVDHAFDIISSWKDLERLTLEILEKAVDEPNGILYLPFHRIICPFLKELKIAVQVKASSQTPARQPLVQVNLQDIGSAFQNIQVLVLERCWFVAAPIHTDHGIQRVLSNTSSLTRFEMNQCHGFFINGAVNAVAKSFDLASVEVFRMTHFKNELGDDELRIILTHILNSCTKLRELDLSDNNIRCLNLMMDAKKGQNPPATLAVDLFVSCLPKETPMVLELSRNPALDPPENEDKQVIQHNIQVLWSMAMNFPLLGFVGKFSSLFLGRLGESYDRLGEYYQIIHHLAMNRARSRVLSNQTVPRGLWVHIFHKSQRAFDDYPNHTIAKNRKGEADAIYNLLKERGAEAIFENC